MWPGAFTAGTAGIAGIRTRDARYLQLVRSAGVLWRRGPNCLRRGTFHRGKVPKTRRGLRPPVPLWAVRRASPEAALRGQPHSTGPSRPLPLQGFARDSKIAEPLRLRGDSLRPHPLPRNRAGYSTRQFLRTNFPPLRFGAFAAAASDAPAVGPM